MEKKISVKETRNNYSHDDRQDVVCKLSQLSEALTYNKTNKYDFNN